MFVQVNKIFNIARHLIQHLSFALSNLVWALFYRSFVHTTCGAHFERDSLWNLGSHQNEEEEEEVNLTYTNVQDSGRLVRNNPIKLIVFVPSVRAPRISKSGSLSLHEVCLLQVLFPCSSDT